MERTGEWDFNGATWKKTIYIKGIFYYKEDQLK